MPRLKTKIADIAKEYSGIDLDIQIRRDVDRVLYQKPFVITSDSIILDHCISWVRRYLLLLDKEGIDDPRTRTVLMAALKYRTFVEYREAHII